MQPIKPTSTLTIAAKAVCFRPILAHWKYKLTVPGRSQAAPLTAWLRVPLDWVSSTTVAQFPDESHSTIRRTFTPQHQPHSKRIFCGFCGTHLSYWTEEPPSEADFLSVTLGSLLGDDFRALQELDLLPEDVEPEDVGAANPDTENSQTTRTVTTQQEQPLAQRTHRHGRIGDLDWFEEMIDGSRLGRTQTTRRGMSTSADGMTSMHWEISEYVDDSSDPTTTSTRSKRKIGDIGSGDDTPMKG